jgi:predicted PurR-regulated permease PerM
VYRWAVVAALGVLTVSLAAMAVYTVRSVLVLVLIALFIAVSLDPAVRWLTRHQVRRGVAVTLIFIVALAAVVGLFAAVGPPLIRQGDNLIDDFPRYISEFSERSKAYRELSDRYGITNQLTNFAATVPGKVGSGLLGFIRGFFGAIFTGLLVTVLAIYFLADLPRLRAGLARLFPAEHRPMVRHATDVVVDKVGAYMIGNILISIVAGVSTFAVLTALRVPFALPLAVVVAITDLIPMIGATLGAVISVVVTLVATDLWPHAVLVTIFFVLYQQVENYFVAPRILRNTVDLPAVAVILAGLIGAAVLGLIGALMAIPIAAVIKVLLSPVIREMDVADPEIAAPPPAEDDTEAEAATP